MLNKVGEWLNLDKLFSNLEGYFDAKVNLIKLEIKETISDVAVKLIFYTAKLIFLVVALVCFNIGIALALNAWLNSRFLGFFILFAFYLILFFTTLILSRNERLNLYLKSVITGMFVKKIKPEEDGAQNQ